MEHPIAGRATLAERSRRQCKSVHRRHPNQTFRDGLAVAIERVAAALVEPVEEPPAHHACAGAAAGAAVTDVMNSRHLIRSLRRRKEQVWRDFESERLSSFEIDGQLELRGLKHWWSAGFSPFRTLPVYMPTWRYALTTLVP